MATKTMNIIMALKDRMSQPLKKVSKEIEGANKKVVAARSKVQRLSAAKNDYTRKLKEEEKRLKSLNKSTSKNSEEISRVEAAITGYKKSIEQVNNKLDSARKVTDRYSKELTKLRRNQAQVEKSFKKMTTGAIKSMDRLIARTIKLGVAVAAITSVVGFAGLMELDEGARKVKSIAGETLKLKEIRETLLQQSKETGIRMEELAETQYSAISAGVKAADSAMASVKATKLAIGGFTDSNSALKIMTATMNVYGLTGQKAMDKIADKLMLTQNLGVTTVAELSSSMGSLTPVANSANVSIDELLGGMVALTKNGLKTEEAVTAYKGVLSSVIKPSREAADKARELGIDFSVAAIKSKGMTKFLEEIKEKTGGSTEELGKLFGNVQALSGALILTGKGLEDFKEGTEAMGRSAGTTEEAYNLMSNTISRRLSKLKNTFTITMTSILNSQSGMIGEQIDGITKWLNANDKAIQEAVKRIGDALGRLLQVVKGIFDFLRKYRSVIETFLVFGATIYTVIKAYEAWKAVMVAVNIVQGLLNGTLALSPLGVVAIAVGALVTALYLLWKHLDTITTALKKAWKWFKDIVKGTNSFTLALAGPLAPLLLLVKHFEKVKKAASGAWNLISKIFKSEDREVNINVNRRETDSNSIYGGYGYGYSMQKYAQGGIADKPSIFGEAGPEIAIPLNNTPRSKNLLNDANNLIGGGQGITINFHGNVYGFDDFRERVSEAVVKVFEQVGPNVVGG